MRFTRVSERKSGIALVVALVMGGAAIAGCSSSSPDEFSGTASATSGQEASESASSTLGGPPQDVPEVVRIATNATIQTLDPAQAVDTLSLLVLNLAGANLTRLNSTASSADPSVAESIDVSEDGLTYTFHLRSGLSFSDGTSLDADDVRASLLRVVDDSGSPYTGLVQPIAGVEAPDASTVVIKLKTPYPALPVVLAQPPFAIIPTEAAALGDDFFTQPVFAGAYTVAELGGGNDVKLVRNELYFGPKPVVPTIEFTLVENASTRLAQVQTGQVNIAYDLPADFLSQSTDDVSVQAVPFFGNTLIITRNDVAPLDELGVRQAINLAVDRQQISDVSWSGQLKPNAGFWPTSMTYYDPAIPSGQDLAGAREFLKGTSCEAGCSIELLYYTIFDWSERQAVVIRENLKEIGIDVKPVGVELSVGSERATTGDFQMLLGPVYDYANIPDGLLTYTLDPQGGTEAAFSGYDSPEMTRLVQEIIRTPADQQGAIAAEIGNLFDADRPYVVLFDYGIVSASNLPSGIVTQSSTSFLDVATE